jgi:HSP20 family protein
MKEELQKDNFDNSLIIGTLQDFQEGMDWLFESYFGKTISEAEMPGDGSNGLMTEDKENYSLTAKLPGIKKEDIEISINGNILTLRIRNDDPPQDTSDVSGECQCTCPVGFSRQFTLGAEIEQDRIEARFEEGVLNLRIPKKKVEDNRVIKIQIV